MSVRTVQAICGALCTAHARIGDDGGRNPPACLPGAGIVHCAGLRLMPCLLNVLLCCAVLLGGKDPEMADFFFVPAYHGDQ